MTIPLPLDGQTNGTIRILDQQAALGNTHLFGPNKILDARLGISRTKAGKYNLSIGDDAFSIPGLPSNPIVAGGLPSVGITGFTGFGRQSTNPQWQNPALLDPKVNFTWVKGTHSLKFGYEYEHIWMAVNDNNPLYGSWTYGGGYSLCDAAISANCATNASGSAAPTAPVSDKYWADFLFGATSSYQLANYFVVHLRQTLDSAYAQDDWKVTPKLTLNLGLRWEYGSPYSEWKNYISNFDPASQTVDTITPGAVAGNGITPVTADGVYGKTLMNPDLTDFMPRIGLAYAPWTKTALRGGFGTGYVHYTRAGSGDILGINAPQAQFAVVTQIKPTTTNQCSTPLPAQIIATGTTTPSCYATASQGFPSGLVTAFNPATDNITWVPKNTPDSYVENYFLSVQQQLAKNSLLDIAYVGNHGLHLQGFLNGNQKNPANGFARPFTPWPSDITEALNEFYSNYNALQVRYEQRSVAGLTLLNSFTWEHSLDNASASLEGNTPSPQNAYNLRGGLRAIGLQPATRKRDQPGVRHAVRARPPVPVRDQRSGRRAAGRMADQRHQHRAGGHAVQPDLHAEQRAAGVAADFGDVSRSQRVSAGRGAGAESDAGTLVARGEYRLRELHQLRGVRAAAGEGRRGQCAQPVWQCVAESGTDAGVLRDGPRPQQAVQHAD